MNSPPNRWFVKFRGHTLGPLQTSQVVSSIQKRELGATDKIASVSNPVWKEIGTEKEFASLFPKVSTDSLPLPTPSILMGKNVSIPKLTSSDSLKNSVSLENSDPTEDSDPTENPEFFADQEKAGAKNSSLDSSLSVPMGFHFTQKSPPPSSMNEGSDFFNHSASIGNPQAVTLPPGKAKKKITKVTKTTKIAIGDSKKKIAEQPPKLLKKEALLQAKKKKIAKKEISPQQDSPEPESKKETEIPFSSDCISENNSQTVKNRESESASLPSLEKELHLEKREKEEMPPPTFVENTNWEKTTDKAESKVSLKDLTELFEDLPSNLGISVAQSAVYSKAQPEAKDHQFRYLSIPPETPHNNPKIREEIHWKDDFSFETSKWKMNEKKKDWKTNSNENLESDFPKYSSKATSGPKTIQIHLTISKASVTILFLCLLLFGVGFFGLIEYKKMRDLKDSHLPDPSSPTIELSTTDDPIPSLKAPTRPKRE